MANSLSLRRGNFSSSVCISFMFHMFNTNGISLGDRQCIWLSDAWNLHCNSKYIHICSENGLRSHNEMGHFSPALQFSEWIPAGWHQIYPINCNAINPNKFHCVNKIFKLENLVVFNFN